MALTLSNKDLSMLKGEQGPAARMAMSIVTRMAEVAGAGELLDITAAHIDSTVYRGCRPGVRRAACKPGSQGRRSNDP